MRRHRRRRLSDRRDHGIGLQGAELLRALEEVPMEHVHYSRVQDSIGDPFSESPQLPREKLEEIFADLQSDLRYDHELNGCLNCGICTATCTAAHYYDFSPREIVQLL